MSVHLAVALAFATGLLTWPLLVDRVLRAYYAFRARQQQAEFEHEYPESAAFEAALVKFSQAVRDLDELPPGARDTDIVQRWRAMRLAQSDMDALGATFNQDGGPS